MILLFTDFGWSGPYVGQMHTVLRSTLPQMPIIELMHDAPAFNAKASAYLLAAMADHWPVGAVVIAVVDPGVGSDRRPLAVHAGGRWLIGPDNGLLIPAARALENAEWFEITWRPERLSRSFHGRDLFAPVASQIAKQDRSGLVPLRAPSAGHDWPLEHDSVIYEDGYGNFITGLRPRKNKTLTAGKQQLRQLATFSDAVPGQAFWYENSQGRTEIAVNRGSAAAILKLSIGDAVSWS